MQGERLLQLLCPVYGAWRAADDLNRQAATVYGSTMEDDSSRREAGLKQGGAAAASFVMFAFLVIFAILVPAVQAFSCFGDTNLSLPGWAWGLLILLFWPLGLVWLVFKGGCAPTAPLEGLTASTQEGLSLPSMPGIFGRTGGPSAATILLTPSDTMDSSSLFS